MKLVTWISLIPHPFCSLLIEKAAKVRISENYLSGPILILFFSEETRSSDILFSSVDTLLSFLNDD